MNARFNGDWTASIVQRIVEAQAWHSLKLPASRFVAETNLRTLSLAPDSFLRDRKSVVESVTDARRSILLERGATLPDRPTSTGRLIGFEPDESLSDGAAEVHSRGFFDFRNTPPWDVWLDFVVDATGKPCLISWVPEELLEQVSEGIAANPEQCIFWLPELEALVLNGG
jgi:hypothetical protein